jgi:serine/threonine-protein kinase PknG
LGAAGWTQPPFRWDEPEPSVSGEIELDDESGTGWTRSPDVLSGRQPAVPPAAGYAERRVYHAPVRPPSPPDAQATVQGLRPVTPPTQAAPYRETTNDPPPTSVLAAQSPETQSIMPPAPPAESGTGVPLPDPGTESVLPERSTGTGTRAGTGSGPFPGASRRTSSRASRRGRLGAGLVDVPQVAYRDPASAVLTDPMVAEDKRFCSSCGAKVGRGENGAPGNPEGVCANCDTPFSFTPKLRPHEILGGQYEVLGALAYGGLGWIYLAQDHNVSDRWVVLKGLIDTGDATAMAAAANEQRFLA